MSAARFLRIAGMLAVVVVLGEPSLLNRPFTMEVKDDVGRPAEGVRIVTDNGIVCFTRPDGKATWTEWSLLRRSVHIRLEDDTRRYQPSDLNLTFTPGSHAKLTVVRLTPSA